MDDKDDVDNTDERREKEKAGLNLRRKLGRPTTISPASLGTGAVNGSRGEIQQRRNQTEQTACRRKSEELSGSAFTIFS